MACVIFVGLQASGKSSFYQQRFRDTHIRLNMDMLKTRYRERVLMVACIDSKQPVVIDNTNSTVGERARYTKPFKQAGFKLVAYYFRSSLAECLARNRKRDQKIPEVGIKGTYNKLTQPSYDEGFDEIYYVALGDGGFEVSEWIDEVR
ncbi:MAG: ATP-binding protein [Acidobacteria bacterium]|nr:ATP-binding protein [Acidobacteriota bacterium]